MDVIHDVLHFTREVEAPVDSVWNAYSDVGNRIQWSVPADEEVVYDVADFSTDGEDRYRCGPPGDLSNLGTHHYHVIERPRRLIFSETVRRHGEVVAVALLTWQFDTIDRGTRVSVVDHVASLVGQGMVDGHRNGHNRALDQLADWLGQSPRTVMK